MVIHLAQSGVMRHVGDIGRLGMMRGAIAEHGFHLILVLVIVKILLLLVS